MPKKFGNAHSKAEAILSVFENGEKLKNREITERLEEDGYRISEGKVRMFIYHNMLYKYLERERIGCVNQYFLI